ncbi:MAG: hypothetical protein JWN34_2005 [Bryobacterales bacterium]|nr:hypothetical protein [Bryobacterales bacterium]
MPLRLIPKYLMSVNLLICEKVLQEGDGVLSAIRIVDVFDVPADANGKPKQPGVVRMYACVFLRGMPGNHQGKLDLALKGPSGASKSIADFPIALETPADMPDSHPGATFNIQLNLIPTFFGNQTLIVSVDGVEVAKTVFSIRPSRERDAQG